ncbi:PspA-associated protein PspAB [Streptomyces sp. E-08]|uniref:PspA-associated protein PspAB n=1 Tax=Streptomyces sp. E-08 TaxID=3404047 RepID=UPI003CFA110B
MGLLDSILGRSRPVRPDLDRLFGLPAAALTLEAGTGFVPAGAGSVCFAAVEGGAFARLKGEVRDLLDVEVVAAPDPGGGDGGGRSAGPGAYPVTYSSDAYGYTWLTVRRPAEDLITLVNDLHAVNALLEEAGFGPNLLCSLTAFRAAAAGARGPGTEGDPVDGDRAEGAWTDAPGAGGHRARDLALVYLYKRGTFYPFAPRADRAESRDNTLEVQVRGLLAGDLAMEPDMERWFPVWGAPGLGGTERLPEL